MPTHVHPAPQLKQARSEIELVRVEVTALETTIQELESRATPPEDRDDPTRELRRLVAVAKDMAGEPDPAPRDRVDAERELADLEARVADLKAKRRRIKKRLEREQRQLRDRRDRLAREVRDAEAARDRVHHETETLAGRIATEAASVLETAVQRRHAEDLARQAEIEQAGIALAALEAGIESVVVDAGALRSKLAAIRIKLLGGDLAEPSPSESRYGGDD